MVLSTLYVQKPKKPKNPKKPKKPHLGFIVLVDCPVTPLRLFIIIPRTNNTQRYRIYKTRSKPETIIGKSFVRKVYSERFIGAINLESLKVIVYHDDNTTSKAHTTPAKIVSLVLIFFIIAPSKSDIFIS